LADGLDELADANGEWVDALTLARVTGCPLLCDDVALAALARSLNVPAFGTLSVLVALQRSDRLTGESVSGAILDYFRAQADELPVEPLHVVAIAQVDEWPLGPSVHPVSRPFFWHEWVPAADAYLRIAEGVSVADRQNGMAALHAATLGIIRAQVQGSPRPRIARIAAATMSHLQVEPGEFPGFVAALRAACRGYDLADPLEDLVAVLQGALSEAATPSEAAERITRLASDMSPEDRATVTATILKA
jgi:hypothetical protein